MGQKGDKLTQESGLSAEELARHLNPIGGITSKKMFGGHGIFHEGKMFCIVDSKGNSFMKVDEVDPDKQEAFFFENVGSKQRSGKTNPLC